MEKFSLTDIKKKNVTDVYHYIYDNPLCSKQQIANSLSMSLPTVTQHLNNLTEMELIEESGKISSSIGRKAAAYSAVSTAKLAIGIDISRHAVSMAVLDLYGKQFFFDSRAMEYKSDTDSYLDQLADYVKEQLREHDLPLTRILGIGLSVQGLISSDGQEIVYGVILDNTGLRIDRFREHFSIPCCLLHDSECAARKELWDNPELRNAIYLNLSQHLGGAIILHGDIQHGIYGRSGTFEHMTLEPGGKKCYCGKRGCVDPYLCAAALTEDKITLEEFFREKSNPDSPFYTEYQTRWGRYLGWLGLFLNNLHMIFDTIIVLGGSIPTFFTESDLEEIRKIVYEFSTFRDETTFIQLQRTDVGIRSTSHGAACMFIENFLMNQL